MMSHGQYEKFTPIQFYGGPVPWSTLFRFRRAPTTFRFAVGAV